MLRNTLRLLAVIAGVLFINSTCLADNCRPVQYDDTTKKLLRSLTRADGMDILRFVKITQSGGRSTAAFVIGGNTGFDGPMFAEATLDCYSGQWHVETIGWGCNVGSCHSLDYRKNPVVMPASPPGHAKRDTAEDNKVAKFLEKHGFPASYSRADASKFGLTAGGNWATLDNNAGIWEWNYCKLFTEQDKSDVFVISWLGDSPGGSGGPDPNLTKLIATKFVESGSSKYAFKDAIEEEFGDVNAITPGVSYKFLFHGNPVTVWFFATANDCFMVKASYLGGNSKAETPKAEDPGQSMRKKLKETLN